MENYENKELLKDAAKKSLESLKDLKPGTEEYNTAANMALKLYDMQLKDEAQENEKQLKEDEAVRKVHELELDQEKAEKARKLDWAKIGMKALTFAGTIGMTVYWSICEAGGVTQLSRAIGEGVHELKRGFTEKIKKEEPRRVRGESCGLSLFLCDTTITLSRRSGRTTMGASTVATILCTGYAPCIKSTARACA